MHYDIIVPVYNCEKYLKRCVNSLIAQSFSNWSLILVDDGSTDLSGLIADNYALKYSKIKVIHKKNGGLSSARNIGLNEVSGDYFLFVDPDDWLSTNYLEYANNFLIEHSKIQILMTPYMREYRKTKLKNQVLGKTDKVFDGYDTRNKILKRLFGLTNSNLDRPFTVDNLSTAWAKFYKTSVFKDLRFSNKSEVYSEDLYFNLKCFMVCNFSAWISEDYYHYFKANEQSIVNTYDSRMFEEYKHLYCLMSKMITDHHLGKSFNEALRNRIVLNEISILRNVAVSNLSYINRINRMAKIMNDPLYEKVYSDFPLTQLKFPYRLFFFILQILQI